MEIVHNCPSMLDFYETYLTNQKKQQKESKEAIERFVDKKDKIFKGYDQFLYMPERKVNHKNFRFIMFDDVDMGDEVEAAIYNDGKQATDELKDYINKQMNRIMSLKMNQTDKKLKGDDYDQSHPLDLKNMDMN